jgi:hypothetical protein
MQMKLDRVYRKTLCLYLTIPAPLLFQQNALILLLFPHVNSAFEYHGGGGGLYRELSMLSNILTEAFSVISQS